MLCQQWEAAADPARAAGIRVAHPRSGVVLSPRGGALKKELPLFKLGLGGRFGTGRQWQSWITLDDEVAGAAAPPDRRCGRPGEPHHARHRSPTPR